MMFSRSIHSPANEYGQSSFCFDLQSAIGKTLWDVLMLNQGRCSFHLICWNSCSWIPKPLLTLLKSPCCEEDTYMTGCTGTNSPFWGQAESSQTRQQICEWRRVQPSKLQIILLLPRCHLPAPELKL
jgi:hypothetical protein